jgi:methanogenic corrinoid protein MtbC1
MKEGIVEVQQKEELIQGICDAVVAMDEDKCIKLCDKVVELKIDAQEAILKGLSAGMDKVGDLYARHEYFVPELLLCSDVLYAGLKILRPHLKLDQVKAKGKLLIGVVQGDIHDIGKNLVVAMFEAAGWEVHDLGKDVEFGKFVEEHKRVKADVVGLSTLMTTSMLGLPKIIKMLRAEDPKVKIMVGGAPLTAEIAKKFGADGYAADAISAVKEGVSMLAN